MSFLRIWVYSQIAFMLILCVRTGACATKSWEAEIQSGNDKVTYWIVDKLGVKMKSTSQPNLEIIHRIDFQQTAMLNSRDRVFSVQAWQAADRPGARVGRPHRQPRQRQDPRRFAGADPRRFAGADPRAAQAMQMSRAQIQALPLQARAYAGWFMQQKYGAMANANRANGAAEVPREYRTTDRRRKIDDYDTKEVIETSSNRPTGRSFWVADVAGWKLIGATMSQALEAQGFVRPENRTPFDKLGGFPIEWTSADGTRHKLVSLTDAKLTPTDLAPPKRAKKVDFALLLQSLGPRGRR